MQHTMLSDPGRILINECVKNDIQITPVPGVSSITAALSISGFQDKFLFYGFLPKNENELIKILTPLSQNQYTQIFFVPSKKINFYIRIFKNFYSGRKIVIAKEITKLHESFIRADIDYIKTFNSPLKGELTIVISEGNNKIINIDKEKIVNKAKKYLKKYSLKDTVELILETEKVNKKKIYDLCLKIKNEKNY